MFVFGNPQLSASSFRSIGDSLLTSPNNGNGMAFSTIDADNDLQSSSCAELASGAWW
jgi:hypothetical protein